MKKFIMLLLVLLLVFSLPSTAFAGMVKLYSIQVSAVDNHGELRNPRSINGQTYRANTEIDLMTADPVPYKGYYFKGWQILGDPSILTDTKIIVTQHCEYRSVFSSIGYQVAFDLQNGSSPSIEMKSFGEEISEPVPMRDYFEFGGWYLDAQCSGERVAFPYTVNADVTFYAKWLGAYCDVRFFDEEGQQIGETQRIEYDKCAKAPDDLTKEGHTFNGWNNGTQTLSGDDIDEQKVTDSVDYTAEFSANLYDIRFFDEDGEQIGETQQIEYDQCAKAPNDLAKEGHMFNGWKNGTETLSGEAIGEQKATGAVDYTAEFSANLYEVRFFDEDGEQIGETQQIEYDKCAKAPNDLAKEGHMFNGWKNGTETLSGEAIGEQKVTGAVDYTAEFSANLYEVRFFDEDGQQIGETQQIEYDKCAKAPNDLAKEGHMFNGWKNGTETLSGKAIGEQKVTGAVDYTAEFSANVYDVRFFDEDGQQIGDIQQIEYNQCAKAPDDLTKEGHTFKGWYDGTQILSKSEVNDGQVIKAMDYTAVFKINNYVVTFMANGTAEKKHVAFNSLIPELETPTRQGHDFAGWLTDEGEQWNFATDSMPASNIALNASWDIRKYTVTFYEQNGEIPIGAPQTVNWGGAVVIETAPAITGYAFDQWVLSGSDASETDSLACVKENINAVACYTKNKYSVTFIDDQGQVIGTDSVCDGGSATAPNVPEKQGYTFIGWDNSFDNVTGNTMVAAQYTANTYTVRFLDNDGSELSTQTVNWNTAATAPADPQREGYTFTGWDTAFDNVTSDITVTAQYERILALANSVGNDELENDVSTSTSYDIESGNNEHLKGNDNGEWIILRDEAIPAASSETNDQSRYRESVSHRNRVSFLNHFSEYIIILLCLLSALALGLSIWIVRARKKY